MRPDATFGWGVVFSEETLGALRDADDRDVPRDHGYVRPLGSGRHPLPRARPPVAGPLVLGDRAEAAAGDPAAALPSRSASTSPSASRSTDVPDDADLVVGADGVNSVVRRAHEREFGTSVEPEGCKYVWFGTDLRLRRVHVHLPRDRARALPGARVPVRRAHEHVHRRVPGGDVAARRPRRAERGREPRLLRAALRARPRGPRAALEPLDLARLPEGHATRPGTTAAPCSSATPPTPRTSRSAPGRSSRWRTRSRSGTRSCAARGTSRPRSSTTSSSASRSSSGRSRRRARAPPTSARVGALPRARADSVRLQPAHAERPHQHASLTVRDPAFTRALDAWFARTRRADSRRRRPCSRRSRAGAAWSSRTASSCGRARAAAGAGLVLSGFVAVSAGGPDHARDADDRRVDAGGPPGRAPARARGPARRVPPVARSASTSRFATGGTSSRRRLSPTARSAPSRGSWTRTAWRGCGTDFVAAAARAADARRRRPRARLRARLPARKLPLAAQQPPDGRVRRGPAALPARGARRRAPRVGRSSRRPPVRHRLGPRRRIRGRRDRDRPRAGRAWLRPRARGRRADDRRATGRSTAAGSSPRSATASAPRRGCRRSSAAT